MWCCTLFPKLLNMSLTAGVVILAVLVIRLLLRRAPKIFSYVLWIAVAFRLVCPVSFSSAFSLLNAVDSPVASTGQIEYVPVDIVHTAYPSVNLPVPGVSEIINGQLPQGGEKLPADPQEAPMALATLIWLCGMGLLLLWAAFSYLRLRLRMRTAVLLSDNVFQSDQVQSPFILGFIRPKIYIPFGLDDGTLYYVLAHERHHLKRKDHWVKAVAFLILSVHWFNPLCWLAFCLMGKDMEMSCDEKVLSRETSARADYSAVLLSFAANRRFPVPVPLAFGETSAKSRIKNALKWQKPRVWVSLLAAILCIAAIAACTANPVQDSPAESGTPYDWTSTVNASDIVSVRVRPPGNDSKVSMILSDEETEELVTILNNIPSESIYTGRGIPAQLSVVIEQSSQTIYMNFGGDTVEISFLISSADGIWEIHDDAFNAWMARQMETAQNVYQEYTEDEAEGEAAGTDVIWEYTPHLSSGYPGFAFTFRNFSYTHVQAACSDGQLIGRDTNTQGQSMTYTPKHTLYWTPATADSLNVPSAIIQFTVYDGDSELYSGSLLIEQTGSGDGSFIYSAQLSGCSELMLRNNTGGAPGGALYRLPVHDLTKEGPITMSSYWLSYYHFRTNYEQILIDFSSSAEPVELQLYATDAEEPLLFFSNESKNLRSCTFSGLTSAREYYLAIPCAPGTELTISDGVTHAPRVHPITGS